MRISWDPHQYADNQGISYHLQKASGSDDYVNIYRGGNTKFTWKVQLEHGVVYKFRVQVRTTEGVGNWSEPVETTKAAPGTYVGSIDARKSSSRTHDGEIQTWLLLVTQSMASSIAQLLDQKTKHGLIRVIPIKTSAFQGSRTDFSYLYEGVAMSDLITCQ